MKLILTSTALTLAAGMAAATPTIDQNTQKGVVIAAESNGMTLYTFRQDQRGVSNCDGSCAGSWPPFLVSGPAAANDGSQIILRSDGSQQWANAQGMPLYFWAGDTAPGQTSGDGVGGVWDVARR